MKSLKKIVISILLLIIFFSIINCNSAFAAYDMMGLVNNQVNAKADANVTDSVNSIAGSVITIARVICTGVAIAMLTILGMKYMMSAPGDKADIKKHAVPYVVGAVIMFACTSILTILEKFAASF